MNETPSTLETTVTAETANARWATPFASALLTGLVALGLTACEDSTGPAGTGSGTATVTLSGASGGAPASAARTLTDGSGLAPADLDAVSSLVVRLDGVQVHRAGAPEDTAGGEEDGQEESGPAWVDLAVESVEIDLMGDLSAGQEIVLAEGELAAGSYDQVRLFVDSAAITFSEPQPVPGAGSDSIRTAQLTIPSAAQSGIKIPGAGFTVEDEGVTTVEITFDAGTSVQNIVITGNGDVKMSPVLHGENATGAERDGS